MGKEQLHDLKIWLFGGYMNTEIDTEMNIQTPPAGHYSAVT